MKNSDMLTPFPQPDIAGVDIRRDDQAIVQYHSLKDLRSRVRAMERKAMSLDDVYALNSEWKKIYHEAEAILKTQSKDLEVTAWLIESSIRVNGFDGLANSLEMLFELLKSFWMHLYPLPDDEGMSTRLFPIAGLNGINGEGTLIMPIRMAPLVKLDDGSYISGWEYAKACELAQTVDAAKRKRKMDDGVVSLDSLRQAASGVLTTEHLQIAEDIERCISVFSDIDEFLMERCAHDAPPTSQIKNALDEANRAIRDIARIDELRQRHATEQGDVVDVSEARQSQESESLEHMNRAWDFNVHDYKPASREQALVLIKRLAKFFRDTEPHSPISYQMERASRWADMNLVELMNELLDDDAIRSKYYRLIGAGGVNERE